MVIQLFDSSFIKTSMENLTDISEPQILPNQQKDPKIQ